MGSATLTSVRTCTPTPSCPEAPPCTPVSPIVCRRRSPPSLPPPSRSRSSLLPRGSTPSGSEDPSWPPCPPSSRCGSPGVRRVRPLHCPPQVLLRNWFFFKNNLFTPAIHSYRIISYLVLYCIVKDLVLLNKL